MHMCVCFHACVSVRADNKQLERTTAGKDIYAIPVNAEERMNTDILGPQYSTLSPSSAAINRYWREETRANWPHSLRWEAVLFRKNKQTHSVKESTRTEKAKKGRTPPPTLFHLLEYSGASDSEL